MKNIIFGAICGLIALEICLIYEDYKPEKKEPTQREINKEIAKFLRSKLEEL